MSGLFDVEFFVVDKCNFVNGFSVEFIVKRVVGNVGTKGQRLVNNGCSTNLSILNNNYLPTYRMRAYFNIHIAVFTVIISMILVT